MIHWSHLLFSKCHSSIFELSWGCFKWAHKQALVFSFGACHCPLVYLWPLRGESYVHDPSASSHWKSAHTSDFLHPPRPPPNSKSTCESPLLRLFSQLVSPQNSHMETTWGWAHWDSQVTSPYWVQNYSALLTINALLSGQCLCWHSLSPANLLCDPGQNI